LAGFVAAYGLRLRLSKFSADSVPSVSKMQLHWRKTLSFPARNAAGSRLDHPASGRVTIDISLPPPRSCAIQNEVRIQSGFNDIGFEGEPALGQKRRRIFLFESSPNPLKSPDSEK
jgi:hypothetical protein